MVKILPFMLIFQKRAFELLLYLFKEFAMSASGSKNGSSLRRNYLFKQMMTKLIGKPV